MTVAKNEVTSKHIFLAHRLGYRGADCEKGFGHGRPGREMAVKDEKARGRWREAYALRISKKARASMSSPRDGSKKQHDTCCVGKGRERPTLVVTN
jgi:hypothetical protein